MHKSQLSSLTNTGYTNIMECLYTLRNKNKIYDPQELYAAGYIKPEGQVKNLNENL